MTEELRRTPTVAWWELAEFEEGWLCQEQQASVLQRLIDNGQAWTTLQGAYGRAAAHFIEEGLCLPGGVGERCACGAVPEQCICGITELGAELRENGIDFALTHGWVTIACNSSSEPDGFAIDEAPYFAADLAGILSKPGRHVQTEGSTVKVWAVAA